MDDMTYLDAFLVWMKDRGKSESTQKEYLYNVRSYLGFLQKRNLSDTTKLDVMRYLTREREKGNSVATRNRKLMAIRTFYKALVDVELLKQNPAETVEAIKPETHRLPVYLDLPLYQAFMKTLTYPEIEIRTKAILLLMVQAGLRVGEVHALNVGDLKNGSMKGIQVIGKGKKERYIPISDSLYDLIQQVIMERPQAEFGHSKAVFLSRQGTRLSRRRIQQIVLAFFEDYFPEHSEGKFTCHKLRHTFGTNLVRAGVDLRIIQELMGHESPSTTQIYTHVHNEQKIEAIQQFYEWQEQLM